MTQVFAIISAHHRNNNDVQNVIAHDDLIRDHVRPLPYEFREVLGKWEGVVEQSVQIFKPEALDLDAWLAEINQIAFELFDQEATLVVHSDLSANLFYPDGSCDAIPGEWGALTLYDALNGEGWTFINGDFYGVS